MCFRRGQIKDIHDKGTGQGNYRSDKYPTPSWKLKAGESDGSVQNAQDKDTARQNTNRTSLSTNDNARG